MPVNYARALAALEQVAPYNALDRADLERLAQGCRELHLEPHEVLLHDGDIPTCTYVLVEGALTRSLVTPEAKSVLLSYTRPVTSFACSCLFAHGSHLGVIEAAEPSTVIAVPGEQIKCLVAESPSFAVAMVHRLASSSTRLTASLYELMLPVPVRVARFFFRHADKEGSVELEMSKGSLAEMLGTVPETLSRALAALRREGLIESNGRTVRVVDLDKLRTFAQL